MRLSKIVLVLSFLLLVLGAHSHSIFQEIINKVFNSTSVDGGDDTETARKKRKGDKYMIPLLFGALLVKSIIFPLAFKAMAVMSSIAVLMSTLSLIISSIVGYVKLAIKPSTPTVKVVHKYPHAWAKDDKNSTKNYYGFEAVDYDPNSSTDHHYYNNNYK